MNREFITEFCRELDFPAEAEKALLKAADAVLANQNASDVLHSELARYQNDETRDLGRGFKAVQAAAEPLPVETGTVELLYYILAAEHLKELYAKAGYSDEMYLDAMADLRCKLFECYNVKGFWGSFVNNWYDWFFSLDRFALGRLQYERCTMPPCISPDGKICFKGNEKAINIHIPSRGPLDPEDVLDSFNKAAAFYADEFPGDYVLLRCRSWLLFPGHEVMLPESSRIRQFSEMFTHLYTDIDKTKHDMWHIFGSADIDDPATLPRDSGLRRAYADWLADGKPVGSAMGIRYVKKP